VAHLVGAVGGQADRKPLLPVDQFVDLDTALARFDELDRPPHLEMPQPGHESPVPDVYSMSPAGANPPSMPLQQRGFRRRVGRDPSWSGSEGAWPSVSKNTTAGRGGPIPPSLARVIQIVEPDHRYQNGAARIGQQKAQFVSPINAIELDRDRAHTTAGLPHTNPGWLAISTPGNRSQRLMAGAISDHRTRPGYRGR